VKTNCEGALAHCTTEPLTGEVQGSAIGPHASGVQGAEPTEAVRFETFEDSQMGLFSRPA